MGAHKIWSISLLSANFAPICFKLGNVLGDLRSTCAQKPTKIGSQIFNGIPSASNFTEFLRILCAGGLMDRGDMANGSYFLLRTHMPSKTVVLAHRLAYIFTLYTTGMRSVKIICQAPLLEAKWLRVVFAMSCASAVRNTKSNAINVVPFWLF